jgi:1L-myo-inositol 1-phosphate cytidylyltransferase
MQHSRINTAIILAAGKNTRFDTGIPKSLHKIGQKTLLERHISEFQRIGVTNISIVTGFRGELICEYIDTLNSSIPTPVEIIHNPEYERANGVSILVCADWVEKMNETHFYCTMADHVYSGQFYDHLLAQIPHISTGIPLHLAVDRPGSHNTHIDLEDVTRVFTSEYDSTQLRLSQVGKMIADYTFFDTGMFVLTSEVFTQLERCSRIGKDSISDMVNDLAAQNKAYGIDLSGQFWSDVDTPEDFERIQHLVHML